VTSGREEEEFHPFVVLCKSEGLRENISSLNCRGNVVQADLFFGNCLTDEVVPDVNVLRMRMTNVVLDMVEGRS
jgi:hypothetical protein